MNKNAIIGIIPPYRYIMVGEGAFEAFRSVRLKKMDVRTSGSTRSNLSGLFVRGQFFHTRSGGSIRSSQYSDGVLRHQSAMFSEKIACGIWLKSNQTLAAMISSVLWS